MLRSIVPHLGLLAALLATPAAAQTVATLAPGDALSTRGGFSSPVPFRRAGMGGGRTQTVFAGSLFGGPQTLTGFELRASSLLFPTAVSLSDVRIVLSTTLRGDESNTPLSTTFVDNIGGDATPVFTGLLSFAAPTTTDFGYFIDFDTDFFFDPSMGNLLLDVLIPANAIVVGSPVFDTVGKSRDGIASVINVTGGDAMQGIADTSGPVVRFTSVGVVPEPGVWAQLIVGFGVVGVGLRARRQGPAVA